MKPVFALDSAAWTTLRRLLDEALALEPSARADWLARLGGAHEALKPRLRALLAHAQRSSPLDALPRVETAQFASELPHEGQALASGAAIGPYRLVRPLGEGGMGAVWLAERTDMLQRRQVALKLPRLLTGRAALAERLAREREILAALNHPNIARLYDAGLTADGQPYLALEYVEGERIDAYCKRKALDVPARLKLFLQVARAVAHAHAQLVVHRDLKPANILVTEAADVRLLDFGIAKLLEDGRAQETELTQLAGRALTPDYAAPEQVLGQPVGTAADVYALGVVLFELLTGAKPYKLTRGLRAALEEAIVQTEPARPSSAVADTRLRKRLRGDLDTIVGKALKKKPDQRYGTVEAFAEDIERHLERRPVRAQPDSRVYRIGRFVARHRLPVVAAASVLLAVLAGATVAVWQARVAIAESRRADEVRKLIESIFVDADPYRESGRPLTAVELLRQAKARISALTLLDDAVRLELLNTLAASMLNLNDLDGAGAVLREAARDGRSLGAEHRQVLRTRRLEAELKGKLGRPDEAKRAIRETVSVLQRAPSRHADELLAAMQTRTAIENAREDYAAAEASALEALDVARRLGREQGPELVATLNQLANAYNYQRRIEPAFDAARRAYEMAQRLFPGAPSHPLVNGARMQYAVTLWDMDEMDRAVDLMRESLQTAAAIFGENSVIVGRYAGTMTQYLAGSGRAQEAVEANRLALRVLGPLYPKDSAAYASLLDGTSAAALAAYAGADALEAATRAREIVVAKLGPEHEAAHVLQVHRARALILIGRVDEAAQLIEAMIERYRRTGYSGVSTPKHFLGLATRLKGQPVEALALQQQALDAIRPGPRAKRLSARVLVEIGLSRLDLQDAGGARAPLTEALSILSSKQRMPTPERANAQLGLGRVELAVHRAQAALPLVEEADAFWRGFAPESRWAGEAAFWLGRCYDGLGRANDARPAYARAAKILAGSAFVADAKLVELARQAPRAVLAGAGSIAR
jgi:serine/threonine-protein kinase